MAIAEQRTFGHVNSQKIDQRLTGNVIRKSINSVNYQLIESRFTSLKLMDSPAAIPTARSTAKTFAAELAGTHSCHQCQYPRRLVVPLDWATAPVRYRGRGQAVPCLTTLYDIAIHWPTIL